MIRRTKTASGEKLTRKYLKQLEAEAEAGYEDLDPTRVRIGRPPLSESGESRRLQVRVDPALDESLKQLAIDQETTVSELARQALVRFVADAK